MRLASTLFVLLILSLLPGRAAAQGCLPATCAAGPQFEGFESYAAGTPVEGLGAVHAGLNIQSRAWPFGPSCPVGSALVVEEKNTVPYDAWAASSGFENDCLTGTKGFTDNEQCVLDYDFTFATGMAVSCFSLRIVDYGDYFPFGGSSHVVQLTAYDAGNNVVDQAQIVQSGGPDLVAGDACSAQGSDPGNHVLTVAGSGIVKVSLDYDAFPDPNVGYDDISFCDASPTPTSSATWGRFKSVYR